MNFLHLFFIFSFSLIYNFSLTCQVEFSCQLGNIQDIEQQSVIDFDVERDLELFHSMNSTHKGVLSQFDHTFTSFGKQHLYQQFKRPLTDVGQLGKIQKSLKFLIENRASLEALQQKLGAFGMSESAFGNLYNDQQDHGEQEIIKKFYFELGFMQGLNQDALALDMLYGLKLFGLFLPILESAYVHYAAKYIRKEKKKHKAGGHHHHHHDDGHFCIASLFSWAPDELLYAVEAAHLGLHLWSVKEMLSDLSAQKAVLNVLYKNIGALSACVKSMHQLHLIVQEHADLKAILGSSDGLSQLFTDSNDPDFVDLRETLLGNYFDQDEDLSIFSRVGTTLRSYKLVQKYLPMFQAAFSKLGTIDALCSIAQHILMHDDKPNSFCFVDFMQDAKTPCIDVHAFWNVVLGVESVTNNLNLGSDAVGKLIITGPNKAGKSSVMKALALVIILAQTYGIAPASAAKMTIFHKILSCMVVTDDISADQSKFVAGLMRADKCLRVHKKLGRGQFAFVVLDDSLLDGTTFEKRQQASYQFIKELGLFDNNLVLVATHLPLLTELEQETQGLFRNYRMKIDVNADGKKESSFCLEQGVCPQDDVFDIIDAQGYNVSFI